LTKPTRWCERIGFKNIGLKTTGFEDSVFTIALERFSKLLKNNNIN